MVDVSVVDHGYSYVNGINRCSSPWACGTCSPVIGERRAKEADQLIRAVLDSGGFAYLVTVTLPHGGHMSLDKTLSAVFGSWRKVFQGRAAQKWKSTSGYIGMMRVVEITHGRNGWHPHIHAVLFFENPANTEDIHDFIYPRWSASVTRVGFAKPSPTFGCDVRKIESGGSDSLSRYLTKVEGSDWSAGREIARSDLKTGRWKGRTPWQIAIGALDNNLSDLELWIEYENSTVGRRRIETTHGLRDRYGVGDEVTDADAAVEDFDQEPVGTIRVPLPVWQRWWDARKIARLLDAIEAEVLSGDYLEIWDELPP